LIPVGLFLLLAIINYIGVFEDAFISFRYARNLAHGNGLVFNPGEAVWGYSNFLWTVILAAACKFGFALVPAAKYLGVMAAVFIIVVFFLWVFRQEGSLLQALAGPLLLAASTHFLLAAQNGLETVFFTGLFLGGVFSFSDAFVKKKFLPWYAVWFLLASLTRPEAPLLMATAASLDLGKWLLYREEAARKRFFLGLILFVSGFGLYTLLMYLYYGQPLPNSFYVKIDTVNGTCQISRGTAYIVSFFKDIRAGYWLWPIFFILFDRRRAVINFILVVFVTVYLLFVIRAGGDFKVYFFRFMIPVLPLILLLLVNGTAAGMDFLKTLLPRYTKLLYLATLVGFLVIDFAAVRSPLVPFFSPVAEPVPIVLENMAALIDKPSGLGHLCREWFSSQSLDIHPMGMVGRDLAEKIAPGKSVATGQCGQIPFYLSQQRILDMIGLMDNEVAKNGISLAYFKQNKIDYCILYYSESPNYYIPLTLYPAIIYSDFFRNHYYLEHVYRHRSRLPLRGLYSEKYMLLFARREKERVAVRKYYNLKNDIISCMAKGAITEMVCDISGLNRGSKWYDYKKSGHYPVSTETLFFNDQCPGEIQIEVGQKAVSQVSCQLEKTKDTTVWTHVRVEKRSDLAKPEMMVSGESTDELSKTFVRAISLNMIPNVGSALGGWLPMLCCLDSPGCRFAPGSLQVKLGVEKKTAGKIIFTGVQIIKEPFLLN
jgi:hypothetical protein